MLIVHFTVPLIIRISQPILGLFQVPLINYFWANLRKFKVFNKSYEYKVQSNFHTKKKMKKILTLSLPGFSLFLDSSLEDRVLRKEAWVGKLLGTHLCIQAHKKVKFSWRDNSSLAVKGLNLNVSYSLQGWTHLSKNCSDL